MRKLLLPVLMLMFIVCYFSCTKDRASKPVALSTCDSTVTYNLRIKRILDIYCAYPNLGTCHDANTNELNVNVDDYTSTVAAFTTQHALCAIEQNCTAYMPYTAYNNIPDSLKLVPQDTINVLSCWAQYGYKQ